MNGPYTLIVGTPGGATELETIDEPREALRERDTLNGNPRKGRAIYFVVGDDTDPPESGAIEWCQEGCGRACLASAETCDECLEMLDAHAEHDIPREGCPACEMGR